ncbi:MAG TPA: glycosyltransferase family 2 protein [Gaiellaceae bacterium]
MPDVAVTLVCINELEDIRRSLEELRAQKGVELEIAVVDNGSTDGSLEFLREQPDVELIANAENRWLSPAWMQGVRATTAPFVLFLTPDAGLPQRDGIARLREALEADPGAALAGPQLLDAEGGDLSNGAFQFPTPRYVVADALGVLPAGRKEVAPPVARHGDETRPVAIVNGAIMLARRSALEQIGFLDERFRLYWEEIDLCKRLGDAGFRVLLVPAVRAAHRGKGSPTSSRVRNEVYAFGEQLYFRKHHGPAWAAAVALARRVERLRGGRSKA